MALTIKKKSGLIIPKTPKLILPGSFPEIGGSELTQKIIEAEIIRIVKEAIGINSKTKFRRIEFIPIYKRQNGEKEISKVYLKQKFNLREAVVNVSDIEASGVMLIEFFDFIITAGAKEIQDPEKALEIM